MLEQLAAAELSARVVALGGGAVTIDDVRQALKRLPHVVWLDAAPEVLFGRSAAGYEAAGARRGPVRRALRRAPPAVRRGGDAEVRTTGGERLALVAERVLGAVAA